MEKQSAGKLKNYNVMKNVSTHSMIHAVDGKLGWNIEKALTASFLHVEVVLCMCRYFVLGTLIVFFLSLSINEGEFEMRLELDEVGVYVAKNTERGHVSQSEKMTQTDMDLINRSKLENGTSPCNHPSLTCQVCVCVLRRAVKLTRNVVSIII